MSLIVKNKQDSFAFLDNQVQKFASETQKQAQQDSEAGYTVSKRRTCGFNEALDSGEEIAEAELTEIFSNSCIIGAPYPLRFLPSPFQITSKEELDNLNRFARKYPQFKEILNDKIKQNEKAEKAIGITKSGKHVVLQQAIASCVPASVAMIVLDHQGKPNYDSIKNTHFATDAEALQWIEKAGFFAKRTSLIRKDKIATLIACLKEHGSGILGLKNGDNAHDVVLDAIEGDMASIRDPFHGWCIDIELDALKEIMDDSFIQITGKKA